MSEATETAEWKPPTRLSGAVFAAKMAVFQSRRLAIDLVGGPKKLPKAQGEFPVVMGQSVTELFTDNYSGERLHQLGKIHNLRRAAHALDGAHLTPGNPFSFWKQVGRTTKAKGYTIGRMLQEGCLSPAIGGGLCQLSSALYDVALQAGCQILERHAHSKIVPGSTAARLGRDATIAWNYVDLRFAALTAEMRLDVRLTATHLVVELRAKAGNVAPVQAEPAPGPTPEVIPFGAARSCATCEETECHLHEHAAPVIAPRAAWLMDEAWPEFAAHLARVKGPEDLLGLPTIEGRQALHIKQFGHVSTASTAAFLRSAQLRATAGSPPARRLAELESAGPIARHLARTALAPEVETVFAAQSLIPFLWADGHLGGRKFGVLMNRLPMANLHARLDAAFAAHPDRASLGDFRAPAWLVEAETAALAAADQIITPHAEIARLFPGRAVRLAWNPAKSAAPQGLVNPKRIAFPGPTAARKGAWAVREAARALDLEVVLTGSELEGPNFWAGVRTIRPAPGQNWLDGVAAVLQPSLVEDQPRKLLAALAAGVPVITTKASGLMKPGLTFVEPDDAADVSAALMKLLTPVSA